MFSHLRRGLITIGAAFLAVQAPPRFVLADDIESTEPIPCPSSLFHDIVIDGILFVNVHFTRVSVTGYSTAVFDVTGTPVSYNTRWEWRQGGASLACELWHIIRGTVRLDLKVYHVIDNWGPLVPINRDECDDDDEWLDEAPRQHEKAAGKVSQPLSSHITCEEGGGGAPHEGEDLSCSLQYGVIEISYDGGNTWEWWWEGWYTLCEDAE